MSLIQDLANWRREVLPKYCRQCRGRCCHFNLRGLSENQVRLIFSISRDIPEEYCELGRRRFQLSSKGYTTNFQRGESGCPQLRDGRCRIYNHLLKPRVCSDYPVFLDKEKKSLTFDDCCPAIQNADAVEMLKNALKEGYKMRDSVHDIDMEDLDETERSLGL